MWPEPKYCHQTQSAFEEVNHRNGWQYSAMGVLSYTFHFTIRLEMLWVAICSPVSARAAHFATVAHSLGCGISQNCNQQESASAEGNDTDSSLHSVMGVLSPPFHTQIGLLR